LNLGPRILAASAVLALATVLTALPAGAISLPGAPPSLPTPTLPAAALPAPSVPTTALPTPTLAGSLAPPLPGLVPVATSAPGTLSSGITAPRGVIGPAIAPQPGGLVPSLFVGASGAVHAVSSAVAPVAPAARPLATAISPVGTARGLVAPVRHRSSRSVARTAQSVDRLSSASESTIRSVTRAGDIRIVPRSVCSSQVATVQPASPALCTSVTREAAAALGLSPSPDRSPFAGVAELAVTGASIAGLVLMGALSLGLGGVVRPFRGSRARRRAALA
jgi:hypothetical protein